jgi:WD40-like Beta Propeller Repeat
MRKVFTSILISLFLLFILEMLICCSTESNNPINYLGQKPPGMTAEIFAEGIISTPGMEHSAPAFSPDGKTLLWSIIEMPSWRTTIREMNYENGKWSLPHLLLTAP